MFIVRYDGFHYLVMDDAVGCYHLPPEDVVVPPGEVGTLSAGSCHDKRSRCHVPRRKPGMEEGIGDASCHVTEVQRGRSLEAEAALLGLLHGPLQDLPSVLVQAIRYPEPEIAVVDGGVIAHLQRGGGQERRCAR